MFKQRLIGWGTLLPLVCGTMLLSVPQVGWTQIEEIIVTARKREENLQEVPLAVTAFGREQILRKGLNTIDQVALLSASLGYESAGSPEAQKLSIRGIAPTRGRQNLAILIDGIDITTESIAQNGAGAGLQSRFMDIQRIELVKGPQSALYGRSAFNGALQYVTQDPSDEFDADVQVEAGEYDRYSVRGSVSGPLGDKWGYRLNGAFWDEEGFYDNERTGDALGGSDGWGGALTLRWAPTDKLDFKFRASYTDQDRDQNAAILIPSNVTTQAPDGACADQFPDDPANPNTEGINSVFECVGFASPTTGDPPAGQSSTDPVAGTGLTIAEFIEGFANPNGTALVAGPHVAGVNEPIAFYLGSVQSELLRAQYRGVMPDMDDVGPPSYDPDPRTGSDFPGSNIEETRLSLIANYQTDLFTLTSWTGYMDGETHGIQDWQQAGSWDLCGTWINPATGAPYPTDPATGEQIGVDPAAACVLGYNDNMHEVEQFSQEFRVASNFDGWQQVTLGLNYWDEDRTFINGGGTVRSRSFDCVIDSTVDGGEVMTFPDGTPVCGVFSVPITGDIFQDVLDARPLVFQGALAEPNGQRDTEHFSAYFLFETDLDDMFGWANDHDLTLSFEGRWNTEETKLRGLDSSGSGSTGAGVCGQSPLIASLQTNPAGPVANSANGCSGQFLPGWFLSPTFFPGGASTGGPPNVPFDGTLGYTVAPCAQIDLNDANVRRDPTALVLNCGVPAEIRDACAAGIASRSLTADGLDVVDADGNPLNCFETFHTDKTDTNWFTPRVSLSWQPNDNMLYYFSWARGEKPAGFNTIPFGSSGFNPETDEFEAEVMDVWEVGYKTTWLDNTLTVNGAFFFQDYTDKQVNTQVVVPDPLNPGNFNTSPKTINASGAEVPGLEVDLFWAPTFDIVGGNMTLGLSYTYLDAEYTDYALPTTGGTDVYVVNNCTPAPEFIPDPSGGPDLAVPQCIVDRSGNSLEDAPEHSAVLQGGYYHPFIDNSQVYFEFDTTYRDKAFLEDANAVQTDDWWNTNIRLGWRSSRYEAVFFVNNVFDDSTFTSGFTTAALSSSFYFAHTRNTPIPAQPGAAGNDVRAIIRNGPAFNSAVVVGNMRPPRHWGFRFNMRFGQSARE